MAIVSLAIAGQQQLERGFLRVQSITTSAPDGVNSTELVCEVQVFTCLYQKIFGVRDRWSAGRLTGVLEYTF